MMTTGRHHIGRAGLTLVEVLLAVFILGIGIVSIAALFPAGIAQQRQSVDEVIGAVVAENAVALLRTRVNPASFGPPSFGPTQPTNFLLGVVPGDFGWARPGFVTANTGTTINGNTVPKGSILVFNPTSGGNSVGGATPSEVPWNETLHGNAPPTVVFTQRDRYYPMVPTYPSVDIEVPRPQFVWETMFRRFQGRVQVAILVYRVTRPGGEGTPYVVQANPSQPLVPPLPIRLNLNGGPFSLLTAGGIDGDIGTRLDNAQVPNTAPGSVFEIDNDLYAWQLPGQWLLDQNNNIHRVLSGRRRIADGPVILRQPVPIHNFSAVHFQAGQPGPAAATDLWYIPLKDSAGNTLTPVFVTVREL